MKRVATAGALLCLDYIVLASAGSDASLPRGVGPEFAQFYQDPATFTCISNPSIQLPVSRLNDDFCDCPDGSDEPGTAACAHLSAQSPQNLANHVRDTINATLALPGFYCANAGHRPAYIPFTHVNDGLCDFEQCCDGSDEWATAAAGVVKPCKNRCDEIGKAWRKADAARQKSADNASRKRAELVADASRLRQQIVDKIQTLGAEIEGAKKLVGQMEVELEETVRKESGKVVHGAGKGGKVGVLVGLAKQRVEELRSALITVRQERDEKRSRLEELETIMSAFKEEYNPNFNDEGVKRAVRAWEDYIANKGPDSANAAYDRDLDEITKTDEESGLNWEEYENGDEGDDTDVLYAFENYLPPSVRSWLDVQLRNLRTTLVANGILADRSSSGSNESKRVVDARNRVDKARSDLINSERSLESSKADLEKDFGPDDVFRALQGTCIETGSGEYTYELCFLEKTTQKPKKGGANTNMGSFVSITTVTVDDELPADGRGLGSGERIALKYENGQHCWNGPNRRTTAVLACAEQNELWKIVEEEKCVYRMEVGTPAVCDTVVAAGTPGQKDEL